MMTDRNDPKTLVNNIVVDTKSAAQDTVALAKAEVQPAAKAAGAAGGMFGAAGYLAANAASLLFLAGGLGFAVLFANLFDWGPLASTALGFVTMAVLLLILAGILAMVGKGKLKDVKAPKAAVAEAKNIVETLKGSFQRGVNSVDAEVRDRKSLAEVKKQAKDVDTRPASSVATDAPRATSVQNTASAQRTTPVQNTAPIQPAPARAAGTAPASTNTTGTTTGTTPQRAAGGGATSAPEPRS